LSSSLGLRGIGFAYILSWTLGLISSLLLIWRRHFRLLLSMDNFIFIGQILATLVVVAALLKVLLLFALGAVQTAHGLRLLSWTLMLGMAGFLPFWGLTVHIFRIPELVMLNELIMAKLMAKFRAGPARQQ